MDFFSKHHLFRKESRSFLGKAVLAVSHAHIAPISSRAGTRPYGNTPAHRALSEFEILAFTLHLHPEVVDTVRIVCEGKALFLPSPVKEKGVKPSPTSRCFRAAYSRMVKR